MCLLISPHSGAPSSGRRRVETLFDGIEAARLLSGIAESGSFSKAAIRLSVAQPILSRQIKLLESELGVELLYRNGRGVVVSEAGKVLETYARSVVDLVDEGALRNRLAAAPSREAASPSPCRPRSAGC